MAPGIYGGNDWTIDRGNWPLTGHVAETALTDAIPLGRRQVPAQFLCRSARTEQIHVAEFGTGSQRLAENVYDPKQDA